MTWRIRGRIEEPYSHMTVQYRESSQRWFAWLGRDNRRYFETDCCARGHKSLPAAARHGVRRVELWAIRQWTDAAEVPGTWAQKVLR